MGFGYVGISIVLALYEADVPVMLEETFGLGNFSTGLIMNIDALFATGFMPVVTAYSDVVRTRIGRRLPFVLVGMPLMALFFALSALMPMLFGSSALGLSTFVLMLIFTNVFLGTAKGPFVALMSDITKPVERSLAYGFLNFMGGVGSMLAYFGVGQISSYNKLTGFAMASGMSLLCAIIVGLSIKEVHPPRSFPQERIERRTWWQSTLKFLNVRYVHLWIELLGVFFWFLALSALEVFYVVFAVMESGLSEATAERLATTNLGIMSLVFALFAVPSGWLGTNFKKKRIMMFGLLLTSYAVFKIMSTTDLVVSRGFFVLLGIGTAMVSINSYPAVMDMAKPEHNGTFTAFYLFASQLAYLVSAPLVGFMSDLVGSRAVFFRVALICIFLAFVFLTSAKAGKVFDSD